MPVTKLWSDFELVLLPHFDQNKCSNEKQVKRGIFPGLLRFLFFLYFPFFHSCPSKIPFFPLKELKFLLIPFFLEELAQNSFFLQIFVKKIKIGRNISCKKNWRPAAGLKIRLSFTDISTAVNINEFETAFDLHVESRHKKYCAKSVEN